jgi:hypothetical protein
VVLFHTMMGVPLVPLIGKALEQKRFWVNWTYTPICDMRQCCWRRTPRIRVGCIVWMTSPTRAQCLITGSSRSLSHLVRYELFATHKDGLIVQFFPSYYRLDVGYLGSVSCVPHLFNLLEQIKIVGFCTLYSFDVLNIHFEWFFYLSAFCVWNPMCGNTLYTDVCLRL